MVLKSESLQLLAMNFTQGFYSNQHISAYNSSESQLQQSRQGKYVWYSPISLCCKVFKLLYLWPLRSACIHFFQYSRV